MELHRISPKLEEVYNGIRNAHSGNFELKVLCMHGIGSRRDFGKTSEI